ncbi:hypothetical protein DsansV1_C06g0062201 [Dioscorea sansibarensis]
MFIVNLRNECQIGDAPKKEKSHFPNLSPSLLIRRYALVSADGRPRLLRNSIAASNLVSSSFSMSNAQFKSLPLLQVA